MMTARGMRNQDRDITLTLLCAFTVGFIVAYFMFSPEEDEYQTAAEVDQQSTQEANKRPSTNEVSK